MVLLKHSAGMVEMVPVVSVQVPVSAFSMAEMAAAAVAAAALAS